MSKPLRGWMILEDYADDMSHWNGIITGPDDPTGANLAWENPIEMIQVMPDTITISINDLGAAWKRSLDREQKERRGYPILRYLVEDLFGPLASDAKGQK